ncbi:MAG: Omp28-related outer membrane protein [Alistipes sp.]|nr:Omp28-related outer membrane protein [Alistipes sp.]
MKLKNLFGLICGVATLMVACEDPEQGSNQNGPSGTGDVTLSVVNYSVEINTPINFIVKDAANVDVTANATIFDKTHNYMEVSNPFTPTEDGQYEFYAVAGTSISNTIKIDVVPTIPALPEDPQPTNTSFNHRLLLVDHTGTNCGFCPEMMKALKEVEAMEGMHDKYYETMAHSYNTSDPAFSAAAGSISTFYGVKDYPRLTYNFVYDIQSDRNASHIAQQINTIWKEYADAGIAASASLATTSVVVNAEVKAAVANEYRVTAWLLEDGIEGTQKNATEDWMNIHNNAIRQAATLNPISGFDLGTIEAGKCATQAMNLAITGAGSNKWNRDNLKVMVIASAKNGAGKFEVVNVVICPVNSSVTYDYKK